MLETSAQLLAEKVSSIIHGKKWESIVFHAILLENSFQFDIFYQFIGMDCYEKDTNLVESGLIQRNELIRCYFNLRKIIRDSLLQNNAPPITGITMTIKQSGRFSIDYEYEEQEIVCSDEWKHHYLVY